MSQDFVMRYPSCPNNPTTFDLVLKPLQQLDGINIFWPTGPPKNPKKGNLDSSSPRANSVKSCWLKLPHFRVQCKLRSVSLGCPTTHKVRANCYLVSLHWIEQNPLVAITLVESQVSHEALEANRANPLDLSTTSKKIDLTTLYRWRQMIPICDSRCIFFLSVEHFLGLKRPII